MFRVKLRRRKYSLRMRMADRVGRYGFLTKHTSLQRQLRDFNWANISAGSSDMLS